MEKRELQQYQALKREQAHIEEELERLEAVMTAPKVQQLTGMPGGGGGKAGSALDSMVAVHAELMERYRAKLEALATAQLEIERAIESLEPTERQMLRLRYIDGLKWEEICVRMAYSWRGVHKVHLRALDKLREKTGG